MSNRRAKPLTKPLSRREHFGGAARSLAMVLCLVGVVVAGVLLVAQAYRRRAHSSSAVPTALSPTSPGTAPATHPASAPAPPPKPTQYLDVVRLHYPDYPTTQPLMVRLSMKEAARFVIPEPIYLDNLLQLWITRPDAEPTHTVLNSAAEKLDHVTRERVVYVHRWPDEQGTWQPQLVVRKPSGEGFELVSRAGRQEIGNTYAYHWHRAFSWNDAIVVPSDRGVSILRPDRRPMELYHEFVPADQFDPGSYAQPQTLLDWRGMVAWMPWEQGRRGSDGAVRFVDGQWVRLDPASGWPRKLLHLVPMLDGSLLQLVVKEDQTVEVAISPLDPAPIEDQQIIALVQQLSDPESEKRIAAFNQLTRYGPGIWPVLQRLQPDQPPEAQIRIEQLLSNKIQPSLGGMVLRAGGLKVIARADYGAAVFYAEAGVTIARDAEDEQIVAPAWICIQPGRAIELAPPGLVQELQPRGRRLSIVRGEWIVIDQVEGPRWWLGNHLSGPLLRPGERAFSQLIGQDCRGRWLFRKPEAPNGPTLIIDPTLPDPTPRLPVWEYVAEGGRVGWTKDNWPAIERGGAWALVDTDWRPLDPSKGEQLLTETESATGAGVANLPATTAATAPAEPAILVEADGTRYYDGRRTLRRIDSVGRETVWPLPPEAVGAAQRVVLLRAGENRLFLFNQPGRVLRIKPTPDAAEPFKLEATFTRKIPNTDQPQRIWLDPAGRIIIAHDGFKLAMLFPGGRIPPEIAKKMTAQDLQEAEE
ncbi:hypothetical protein [Fontivita pretiosa]|uniref:hypothetical protein n=1 Tax=Fontivita pretiosa TaxID=2989684 RepID=UPI003D167B49